MRWLGMKMTVPCVCTKRNKKVLFGLKFQMFCALIKIQFHINYQSQEDFRAVFFI